MILSSILCYILFLLLIQEGYAFTTSGAGKTVCRSPVSEEKAEWQKDGVEIELPNLVLLFDRITQASPLAKQVIEQGNDGDGKLGFEFVDDEHPEVLWRKVESNKRKTVHKIEKADSFQNVKVPLLRFRSTINGPCIGERFSHILTHIDERKQWDDQVKENYEIYPIDPTNDYCRLDNAILCDEDRFGKCKRIGVGYTETKQGIIAPREQLILGGMQEYDNGATILWGTEMDQSQNHLFPQGKRHVRAHSHMFAATLAPTGPDSFDVEYLLQMDVGGGLPYFMITPAIISTVKNLFKYAEDYYAGGEGSELEMYLKQKLYEKDNEYDKMESLLKEGDMVIDHSHPVLIDNESILFTP